VRRAERLLFLLLLTLVTSLSWAQAAGNDRTIELKGGERVVLRADGTMVHYDKSGKPMAMPDGSVMIAKDGSRIMMKSESLWREVLALAATNYARATTGAITGTSTGQRTIELKDGGRVVLSEDGAMAHYDTAGNRQGMPDGEVMIAKDGTRILMNNGRLWRPELGSAPSQR
jgi:hypothetical protein